MKRGERYRAFPEERPAHHVFIKVTRVARDGKWADIVGFTWAVMWRKRQPLRRGRFPFPAERFDWDGSDLYAQEMDWQANVARPPLKRRVDGGGDAP